MTATRSLSQIVALAELQRRESGVTSYESPKRWPICAVNSIGPTSQRTDASRSLKRDCRSQAPLADDATLSACIAATIPTTLATGVSAAHESAALTVSWTAAILLNEKFVKVAVNVAMPNLFVTSPSLAQSAGVGHVGADETTATRHGRATPPPNHIPP